MEKDEDQHLAVIRGDITDGKLLDEHGNAVDFIVHQTNCITTHAKGLAELIFGMYPNANDYKNGQKRKPGNIIIHQVNKSVGTEKYVVNLYGQNNPGKPKYNETLSMRLKWFADGLNKLSTHIIEKYINDERKHTIAFPHLIGCGLAGGNWEEYKKCIHNFKCNLRAKMKNINVIIVNYN